MLQRVLNEAKARRYEVGVMVASSSALEPLSREKLLTEVKSPLLADLIPESIAPNREWASVYLAIFVQAYNTKLVRKDELPKTYRDLLNPRWKGRLAVEAEDYDWFAQVVLGLGEAQGLKLFRDIVATNGISVRRGHSVLNNLIVAGEIPLGLSSYGFLAEQAKVKGAPIDWFVIPPLMARPTAAGVSRYAPQPHAAVLFYDFLIGDAQPILASRQFVSPSRKIESPFTARSVAAHRLGRDARQRQEVAGPLPVDHRQGRALTRSLTFLAVSLGEARRAAFDRKSAQASTSFCRIQALAAWCVRARLQTSAIFIGSISNGIGER